MSRLILVGEAPGGAGHEVAPALEGLVGKRLAKMMELPYDEYLSLVARHNLFETPNEGKRWNAVEARLRAMRMAGSLVHGDRMILLGDRVAVAFGCPGLDRYQWTSFQRVMTGETFWVARVPHPSGRNRLLNSERERRQMASFLWEAVRDRA